MFLDPNQYQQDMTNTIQNGAEDVYETFNIIMRRKPKENNFKVILCLYLLVEKRKTRGFYFYNNFMESSFSQGRI